MNTPIILKRKSRTLTADLETPISLFKKILQQWSDAILLESAEVDGRWGRYSVLVWDFAMVLNCRKGTLSLDIRDERLAPLAELEGKPFLSALRELIAHVDLVPDEQGNDEQGKGTSRSQAQSHEQAPITRALYGYMGYEMAALFQPKLAHTLDVNRAECTLVLPKQTLVFDHLYNQLVHIALDEYQDFDAHLSGTAEPVRVGAITQSPDKDAYIGSAEKVCSMLHDGEAIQVVLSTQASTSYTGDEFELYRRMRRINPSPYMFYMALPGIKVFGSSPELLVRCTEGKLQLSPIAGTRKRGLTEQEDADLAADLLQDPKERAEHVMLVDLGRNDLGAIAKPGSVHVERLMEVERFSHVMHLTSRVTAQLDAGLDALDILASAFPAGTVSGAPKVRAMEIIAESEPMPRGPYAGCIGWIGLDKDAVHMDMGITIRSMWTRDGLLHWQSGAGVVYDSRPEAEWEECMNKARIMRTILNAD